MALPGILQPGLLPSEAEYLATSTTTVQIVPLTSIDRARFLSAVYGPFRPPQRTTVPLWLALNLKKRGKCYIVPPAWMQLPNLQPLLQRETTSPAFAELPFHYLSLSKAILDVAADDVQDADEVRGVLKDIREARQKKIEQGLGMVNPYHLEMTNIAYAELCELRPFFSTAFHHLRAMRPPPAPSTSAGGAGPSDRISSGYEDQLSQSILPESGPDAFYRDLETRLGNSRSRGSRGLDDMDADEDGSRYRSSSAATDMEEQQQSRRRQGGVAGIEPSHDEQPSWSSSSIDRRGNGDDDDEDEDLGVASWGAS